MIGIMALRVRRMTEEDVEECLQLARNRPFYCEQYGAMNTNDIARVLRDLLTRQRVNGGVLEDLAKSRGERILSAGCTAFVQPDWLRRYLQDPFPFPGSYILKGFVVGRDDILLNHEQLRQRNSNSEGLSAVLLIMSWNESILNRPNLLELQIKAVDSFLLCHKGFRIAELVHEALPGFEERLCLGGGAWIERDRYAKHFPSGGGPILIGMTRKEAFLPEHATSPLAPLFDWKDFRLCFTPAQQAVLKLVIEYHSDASIAEQLGVGADAVGRRMQRIYRRVESHQDALEPVFPPNMLRSDRRKFLIDYLRRNYHEMLPHTARS